MRGLCIPKCWSHTWSKYTNVNYIFLENKTLKLKYYSLTRRLLLIICDVTYTFHLVISFAHPHVNYNKIVYGFNWLWVSRDQTLAARCREVIIILCQLNTSTCTNNGVILYIIKTASCKSESRFKARFAWFYDENLSVFCTNTVLFKFKEKIRKIPRKRKWHLNLSEATL
jgi:hypothetical protein